MEDPDVLFAGYRHAHPLDSHIEVKIRTTGNVDPLSALKSNTNELLNEINTLENRFRAAVEQTRRDPDYDAMTGIMGTRGM